LVIVPVIDPAPTVKDTPLLDCPPTETTTELLTAPLGMETTILLGDHSTGADVVDPNATVDAPWTKPKLDPEIVTSVPTGPAFGETLVIEGLTENPIPGLETPLTMAVTAPVVAPTGTGATMVVLLQLLAVAGVPLKLIVLAP